MNLIQNLNWLIEQYIRNKEQLENERKDENLTITNIYLIAKIGVYAKVIQDLQGLLEEGEVE